MEKVMESHGILKASNYMGFLMPSLVDDLKVF